MDRQSEAVPKHTPGPWSFNEHRTIVDANRQIIRVPGVALPGYSDPECKANARLVAAAPDLLKSARQTVKSLDEEHNIGNHDDDWIYDVLGAVMSDAYFAARAAIAKATGHQP